MRQSEDLRDHPLSHRIMPMTIPPLPYQLTPVNPRRGRMEGLEDHSCQSIEARIAHATLSSSQEPPRYFEKRRTAPQTDQLAMMC